MTFAPPVVNIRPTYRNPRNGRILVGHPRHHGSDNLAHDARVERGIDQRARREGAHPTGIRSAVFVEDSLVVLSGADRHGSRSVANEKE